MDQQAGKPRQARHAYSVTDSVTLVVAWPLLELLEKGYTCKQAAVRLEVKQH
jgi:hypothetical protein